MIVSGSIVVCRNVIFIGFNDVKVGIIPQKTLLLALYEKVNFNNVHGSYSLFLCREQQEGTETCRTSYEQQRR
jgi:hypothetical protein